MSDKTRKKNELIIALRQLANHMQDVAQLLHEYKGPTTSSQDRAKELVGASMMVKDWAEQIELR